MPTSTSRKQARPRPSIIELGRWRTDPEDPDAEVLLVVEFQAAPHRHMALRMDAYVALLRQEMIAGLPTAAGLPPVLPVLVYAGDRPWPPTMRQLTAPAPPELRRWQPDLKI